MTSLSDCGWTETWFAVEFSHPGAADWYACNSDTHDTIEGARTAVRQLKKANHTTWDFRIVRKTITTEEVR